MVWNYTTGPTSSNDKTHNQIVLNHQCRLHHPMVSNHTTRPNVHGNWFKWHNWPKCGNWFLWHNWLVSQDGWKSHNWPKWDNQFKWHNWLSWPNGLKSHEPVVSFGDMSHLYRLPHLVQFCDFRPFGDMSQLRHLNQLPHLGQLKDFRRSGDTIQLCHVNQLPHLGQLWFETIWWYEPDVSLKTIFLYELWYLRLFVGVSRLQHLGRVWCGLLGHLTLLCHFPLWVICVVSVGLTIWVIWVSHTRYRYFISFLLIYQMSTIDWHRETKKIFQKRSQLLLITFTEHGISNHLTLSNLWSTFFKTS